MSKLSDKIDHYEKHLVARLDGALEQQALLILDDAKRRAPVDTGNLRNSGHVEPRSGGVAVVFDTPYAVQVHEDLNANHAHGEARFLAKAVAKRRNRIAREVARELRG